MKYLKIVFPVLLVVLLGYLYSCNIDNPSKPSGEVSQFTDNIRTENCPNDSKYDMHQHMCLNMIYDGVNITSYARDVYVYVSGRNSDGVEVYTCNYYIPGPSNPTGFGSFLPQGLTLTRRIDCIYLENNVHVAGTQTFVMPESDDYNESDYYMHLTIPCK